MQCWLTRYPLTEVLSPTLRGVLVTSYSLGSLPQHSWVGELIEPLQGGTSYASGGPGYYVPLLGSAVLGSLPLMAVPGLVPPEAAL